MQLQIWLMLMRVPCPQYTFFVHVYLWYSYMFFLVAHLVFKMINFKGPSNFHMKLQKSSQYANFNRISLLQYLQITKMRGRYIFSANYTHSVSVSYYSTSGTIVGWPVIGHALGIVIKLLSGNTKVIYITVIKCTRQPNSIRGNGGQNAMVG